MFILTILHEFITAATEQYEVLNSMYKKMEGLFKDLAKFYCFDPKRYSIEELFADIKMFKDNFVVS